MSVDITRIFVTEGSRKRSNQFLSRKDTTGLTHQFLDNGKLDSRQIVRHSRNIAFFLLAVQFDVAANQQLTGNGSSGTPANGSDPGNQFTKTERLYHVIVGALFESGDFIRFIGAGCQKNNGGSFVFAKNFPERRIRPYPES